MRKSLVYGLFSIALTLGVSPTSSKAETYGLRINKETVASIKVPDQCKMSKARRRDNFIDCQFDASDGGGRGIHLLGSKLPLTELLSPFGISEETFKKNPSGNLRAILKGIERGAAQYGSGPGQKRVKTAMRIVKPPSASGLDECLRYEFDFTDSLTIPNRPARLDNTGIRCFGVVEYSHEVIVIKIEYKNLHFDHLERRSKGFESEASRVIKSLRIQ